MILKNSVIIMSDCHFLTSALIKAVEGVKKIDKCIVYSSPLENSNEISEWQLNEIFIYKSLYNLTDIEIGFLRGVSKYNPHVLFTFFVNKDIQMDNIELNVSRNSVVISVRTNFNGLINRINLRAERCYPIPAISNMLHRISDRQREILFLHLSGLSHKKISLTLKISSKSVALHKINIAKSLGIKDINYIDYYIRIISIIDPVEFEKIYKEILLICSKHHCLDEADVRACLDTSEKFCRSLII